MRYKYTDAETKTLLKNIVILVDSREQENSHITFMFDKKKYKYKKAKLDQGDYSVAIESNEETKALGIVKDLWFDKDVVIERKACIDELANNLKEPERSRLSKEFSHLKMIGARCYFFIEDENFDSNIRIGAYRSEYNPKALYKSIKSFVTKYNLNFRPIAKEYMWSEIYNTLECEVKEILRSKGFVEEIKD